MSELRDFDLEKPGSEGADIGGDGGGADAGPPIWPYLVGAGILLLLVGVWYFFGRGDAPPEPPAVAAEQPAVEPLPGTGEMEQPPVVDLPSLAESDDWMRAVVGQLSSHPALAEWLMSDELLQRFTAAVDNVAEGNTPRRQVDFMAPDESFEATEAGGRVMLDPASYARFDRMIGVAESFDTRGTAELYRSLEPLLDEAYAELGYPDRTFEQTLTRAVNRLLSTPVVDGEVDLVAKVSSYEYADPRLEALTDAQKQFLRLGPDNLRRLQTKVRQLALAVGIPAADLYNPPG